MSVITYHSQPYSPHSTRLHVSPAAAHITFIIIPYIAPFGGRFEEEPGPRCDHEEILLMKRGV